MSYEPTPDRRFHSGFHHEVLKLWASDVSLRPVDLMYPIFVADEDGLKQEIQSLPGQYRWGVDRLAELLDPLIPLGLRSVLLFGVVTKHDKDLIGSFATCPPVFLKLYQPHCFAQHPNRLWHEPCCF